jgi:site-specific DNA-methyltransferase (adenine-specific)
MFMRCFNGDCLELFDNVEDNTIDLVIADPPYNVYDNDVVKVPFQRRNKDVSWDKYNGDFIDFSMKWVDASIRKMKKDASLFVFGGVNYKKGNDLLSIIPMLRERLEFINLIAWCYDSGQGSKRFFSSRFELLAWFAKSRDYTFNLSDVKIKYSSDDLRKYSKDKRVRLESLVDGKNPTNVWFVNRVQSNDGDRFDHPTQKPDEVIRRIVLAASNPGDTVLDPFFGSGTTLKVCKDLDRNVIGFEINKDYYDMAMQRCESHKKVDEL